LTLKNKGIDSMDIFSLVPIWTWFIIVLAVFANLIPRKGKSQSKGDKSYSYSLKKSVLTNNELAFYKELRKTAGNYVIFSKISIKDVLDTNNQSALNTISQKHFDFLLCEPTRMKPVLAIELDDSSHNTDKAKKRDADKNNICKSAGLPLLRVTNATGLQEKIGKTLNMATK